MWYVADYQPTALFSLRPANATTSGGKTLITPTPYAVKMALLDAAIRVYGLPTGERWFAQIRDAKVAVALPEHVMVTNTFVKILRPPKKGPKDIHGTGLIGPMENTIAYRELVQFGGNIGLAIQGATNTDVAPFGELLAQIHYLGKRGGFLQVTSIEQASELPARFSSLRLAPEEGFPINGLLQMLDDCGPKMTFAHADVFSGKSVSINKANGRLVYSLVLPYRLRRSSRGFSLYERITS